MSFFKDFIGLNTQFGYDSELDTSAHAAICLITKDPVTVDTS